MILPLVALLGASAHALRMPRSLFSMAAQVESKSGIGWDSHKAIDQIPDTLVSSIDGNDSMRRRSGIVGFSSW